MKETVSPENKQDLLDIANARLDDWLRRSRQWYFIYYFFGALAVALTITVASRPKFIADNETWLSILAWLAALCQGLSTFAVALPKATAYRAAWRHLWLARANYLNKQQSQDAGDLLMQAIGRGWAIIDGGYAERFPAIGNSVHNAPVGVSPLNPPPRRGSRASAAGQHATGRDTTSA